MHKITFSLLTFCFIVFAQAQCVTNTVTTEVCDMTIIDGNNDTVNDGIINLFERYEAESGTTIPREGTWRAMNPLFRGFVNPTTGELRTWALRNSSESIDDYTFVLETPACGTVPFAEVNVVLGPFSGVARITNPNNTISVEICDTMPLDLFTALFIDESTGIPPAHLNGTWEYLGSSPNFMELTGSLARFEIPYVPDFDVDQETFAFRYTVPGDVGSCASETFTDVNISVVRQVSAGTPQEIDICESDIRAGVWDADIDLRDDRFLREEDVEGNWTPDPTGQISDASDSMINIRTIYDNLIANQGERFGCETFEFTYEVLKRSAVCTDAQSTITFNIYEELRPFNGPNDPLPLCLNESSVFDFNTLVEFTPGFEYPYQLTVSRWEEVSGPQPLTPEDPDDPNNGRCIIRDVRPGIYTYRYTVFPEYNCTGPNNVCASLNTTVSIEILPVDYAGEDTVAPSICENTGTVELRSLLSASGGQTIVTTGVWTNASGDAVDNTFTIPEITELNQTFTFTYTTTTDRGCTESAMLEFTVDREPNPGTGMAVELCRDSGDFNLFDFLQGDPDSTGIWIGPSGYRSDSDPLVPAHLGMITTSPLVNLPSGNYEYIIAGNGACPDEARSQIALTITEIANAGPNIDDKVFCKSDGQVNLFSQLEAGTDVNGRFTDIEDTGALSTDGIVDFNNLPGGLYTFRYEIDNGAVCTVSEALFTFRLTEVAPPVAGNTEFCILEGAKLNDIEISTTNFRWYADIDMEKELPLETLLVDRTQYFVTAMNENGCESVPVGVEVKILNLGEDDCGLDFQDGVSPNGDRMNDDFDIEIGGNRITEVFPEYELLIYNRYGTLVYEANRNTERFRGIANTSIRLGEDLPSGVYFYVFNPNKDNNKPIQGNFFLTK